MLFKRLFLTVILSGTAFSAAATPVEDRAAALEVLNQEAIVERVFSNCKWIRGMPDDTLLTRWRNENADFSKAANALLEDQGGMTEHRRKIVGDLAGLFASDPSGNKEACRKFYKEIREGSHDLSTKVQPALMLRVMKPERIAGDGIVWILEQRRLDNGTLVYSAKRYAGRGDVPECERNLPVKDHIHLRQKIGADLEPVPDQDPTLWLAECMMSPVDPVLGTVPVTPASAGD